MRTTENKNTYEKAKSSFFLAATIEGRSQETLNLYEYALGAFENYSKPVSPIEATTSDIRGYVLNLIDRDFARATVATHIKELRVFYNFLVSEDYLEKSPMTGIKTPKLSHVISKPEG